MFFIFEKSKKKIIFLYFLNVLLRIFAICTILTIFFFISVTIIQNISFNTLKKLLTDEYFLKIIIFTIKQSVLSSLLSNFLAIVLSCAMYRKNFFGYKIILHFFRVTLSLPTIVGIFGIINVFGLHGWIFNICKIFNISYNFQIYGISGILLVHIFFNFPLATFLLSCELENIPIEQKKISMQLSISNLKFFYYVEFPYLKRKLLSVILLIFILCFTSFSTIFIVGGNPKYYTIATEIYQSIYDFNFEYAYALSLIQVIFLLILMLCVQFQKTLINIKTSHYYNFQEKSIFLPIYENKMTDKAIFLVVFVLIILPILSVIFDGLQSNFLKIFLKKSLWKSTIISLSISCISSFISLFFIVLLLHVSIELYEKEKYFFSRLLDSVGLLILIIPNPILIFSIFLKIKDNKYIFIKKIIFISLSNAIFSIPYGIFILNNVIKDIGAYKYLCDSLNINKLNYFYLIEFRYLKKEIIKTISFIIISSFGDLGIISLIGSEDFQTLPFYFYQNMNDYCNRDSFGIALFLIILHWFLFTFLNKISNKTNDIFK